MQEMITRDEAQARGLARYYTGQTCTRGHLAARYVSNGGCVDCVTRKRNRAPRGGNALNINIVFIAERVLTLEEIEGVTRLLNEWAPHALAAVQKHLAQRAASTAQLDAQLKSAK